MAYISDEKSNTLLLGTSGDDTIRNGGYVYKNSTHSWAWQNGSSYVTMEGGAGNDYLYNYYGEHTKIDCGDGNDEVLNYGSTVLVYGRDGNDYIRNHGEKITISGGTGDDSIFNNSYGAKTSISGGTGNDYLYNSGESVTISGGADNDEIHNSGASVLFEYAKGDGNDIIYGFKDDSTLSISGGSYSKKKSGSDIIVTVGDGKISLIGAASLPAVNIVETNYWKLNGTTAKYGTTGKTLVTVKGVKSLDGISLSGTTVTIAKESLGTSKVKISNGYTLALAYDVSKSATTKAWSLKNSTATYKQMTSAGYKLANNAIIYTKKSAKTLATIKGVKSTDGLKFSGKVITVSKASLGGKKVTVSDGYKLKLGSDVGKVSIKKAAWSLSGSTATYKSSYKTAGYTLADNAITYSKATTAKNLATIKGVKSTDGLKISGKTIKPATTSLSNKVTISGGYNFDFAKDYSNATITGSSNDDTIIARGKNILVNGGKGDDTIKILGAGTVKGGAGADVFYYKSSGANVISDYAADDIISIASGTAATSINGDDFILKVGKGKITVTGGANETIIYFDADGKHTHKKTSDFKINAASKVKIDVAKVYDSLEITGDNSLWGDAGSDTLYGGAGDDYISGGDGSDFIADFNLGDIIQAEAKDIVFHSATNDDSTFSVGSGKLVIKGGADKLSNSMATN